MSKNEDNAIHVSSIENNIEEEDKEEVAEEKEVIILPKSLEGLRKREFLFTLGANLEVDNGDEDEKNGQNRLSHPILDQSDERKDFSRLSQVEGEKEDSKQEEGPLKRMIEERFYSPTAEDVFVSQLPKRFNYPPIRNPSQITKTTRLPPPPFYFSKESAKGTRLSEPNFQKEVRKYRGEKVKYRPRPSNSDETFKFVGVVHDSHRKLPTSSKFRNPPRLGLFDQRYVYDRVNDKNPVSSRPLSNPMYLDIPIETSHEWLEKRNSKPIVILSLPKLPPIKKKKKQYQNSNYLDSTYDHHPTGKVHLKPSHANIFISDSENEIDVTLGSRLKTKPVYDTYGYWVPSENPWLKFQEI